MLAGARQGVQLRAGRTLVVSAIGIAALSGCTSPSISSYDEVAVLDPDSINISYPLDEYAMSSTESNEVRHANAVSVERCMNEGGFDYPRADYPWDQRPIPQERRYGLWSMTAAEAFAYGYPADEASERIEAEEELRPEDWWTAVFACFEDSDQLPIMAMNANAGNPSPVDRGVDEAYRNLLGSAEWGAAKTDWSDCLADSGLRADPASNLMLPELPEDPEEQARIAIIDVECKQDVDAVQRVADVEAKYQAAYISSHESELVEYKNQANLVLEQARDLLRSNG